MRKWGVRILMIGIGWRLTMAYPKDNSIEQLAISLVVGLIGAVWIAVVCYLAGHLDGEAR